MTNNLENIVHNEPAAQAANQDSSKGILYHTDNYLYDSVRLALGLVYDGARLAYRGISWPVRTAFKAMWQTFKHPWIIMAGYLGSQISGLYGSINGSNGNGSEKPIPNITPQPEVLNQAA